LRSMQGGSLFRRLVVPERQDLRTSTKGSCGEWLADTRSVGGRLVATVAGRDFSVDIETLDETLEAVSRPAMSSKSFADGVQTVLLWTSQ